MKFIHTADVHFGYSKLGLVHPETGKPARLLDYVKTFDHVLDEAVKRKAGFTVVAGDTFRTANPNSDERTMFAQCLTAHADMPILIITGNHDTPKRLGKEHGLADIQEIYAHLKGNVTIVSEPTFIEDYHGVSVCCLPHLPPAVRQKYSDSQDSDQVVRDVISTVMPEKRGGKRRCILVAHLGVKGAIPGSELDIGIGNEITVSLEVLKEFGFDYVALGHVHKAQVLSKDPYVIYSGGIERINFGEMEEEKSFTEVTLGTKKVSAKKVALEARNMVKMGIAVPDGCETVMDFIAERLDGGKGAIVNVEISVPAAATRLVDAMAVTAKLYESGAFFVLPVGIRPRGRNYESRNPEIQATSEFPDAVKAYLSKKLPDESDTVDKVLKLMLELRQEVGSEVV